MPVKDVSFWSTHAVDNIILEIKVPARESYKKFLITQGELKVISCSDLSICKFGMSDLPDGVYRMKLSYNPNEDTMTEFYHFRDVQARLKFANVICELKDNKCNLTRREFEALSEKLIKLEFDLRASKYMVEEKGEIEKGINMFQQVLKDLENYTNCDC